MEIFRDFLEGPVRPHPTVVGIGVFDGVHRAHRLLITTVRRRASELGVAAGIVTFEPHPQEVLTGRPVPRLSGLPERLLEIEALAIDFAAVVRFTREFSRLSPEEFVDHVLVDRLQVREVVVGFNFHFGRGGTGTPAVLTELGLRYRFDVTVVGGFTLGDTPVSSSTIRDALAGGRIEEATLLLGRPHRLTGRVTTGAGRGRTLGFPTANLEPDPPCLMLPKSGVYRATARQIGGENHPALVNIGTRPTFEGAGAPVTIEAHLLGFDGDLVGLRLALDLEERFRDERRFESVEALVEQLHADLARLTRGAR